MDLGRGVAVGQMQPPPRPPALATEDRGRAASSFSCDFQILGRQMQGRESGGDPVAFPRPNAGPERARAEPGVQSRREQSCLRCTSLPQVRPSVEGHPKKGNHNHAIFYYPNQIPRLCPLAKSQANEWSSGDRQGSAQLGVPRPTRRGYKYLSVFLGFPPARPHPELSPSFPPRGG